MDKSIKSGFVIKLSSETVQKLSEEDEQAKIKAKESNNDPNKDDSNIKNTESVTPKAYNPTQNLTANLHDSDKLSNKKSKAGNLLEKVGEAVKEPIVQNENNDQKTGNERKSTDVSATSSDNPWGDYALYITYEGEEAIYTDPSSKQRYTWDQNKKSWTTKDGQTEVPGREYSYEDDTHVYTEADGSKCFWDSEKKAWLPKVDDDFLAFYQMSYGFVDNSKKEKDAEQDKNKEKDSAKKADLGVKRKNEPQWFDASNETNTKVYVSNLPLELTEEEFVNFMQKCGLVERDPTTQKMKVKLYFDKENNCFKGDALCTYIKIESVELALNLLDGSDLKGNTVKVERAHFQLKGEYNPALKPKKKKKKELEKIKKMQQKLFDWRPEKFIGERSKHERIVIVKNLFHPSDFDTEVQLILDYQQDLREECSKCGEVRKVVIYDRHPEGVAQITMKEPEMADEVIKLINGRWFGKRQITAETWDGRTKYRIAETDADLNQRIKKWDKFLEGKTEEERKIITAELEAAEKAGEEEASKKDDVQSAKAETGETVAEDNKDISAKVETGETVAEDNKEILAKAETGETVA